MNTGVLEITWSQVTSLETFLQKRLQDPVLQFCCRKGIRLDCSSQAKEKMSQCITHITFCKPQTSIHIVEQSGALHFDERLEISTTPTKWGLKTGNCRASEIITLLPLLWKVQVQNDGLIEGAFIYLSSKRHWKHLPLRFSSQNVECA